MLRYIIPHPIKFPYLINYKKKFYQLTTPVALRWGVGLASTAIRKCEFQTTAATHGGGQFESPRDSAVRRAMASLFALAAVRFGDPTRARPGIHKIAGSPDSTTSRSHRRLPETGDHLCKLDNHTSSRRRRLYMCSAGGRGVGAKICRLASFSRSGEPPPLLVIRRPYFFF